MNIGLEIGEIYSALLDGNYQQAAGIACAVPIRADGYVVINEWDRSHLGVGQKDIYCDGYNKDIVRQFRTPVGIKDTERSVRFLVTGDPQYWNTGTAENAEADKVMLNMRGRMEGNHYEAPGFGGQRLRGIVIAGDLTNNTRKDEWDRYKHSLGSFKRFFYDGLGNHDIKPPEWFDDRKCNFGADGCVLPERIYADVLTRNRGSVLSARGHAWDPQEIVGSTQYLSPHYSWDWHDVHFVQLNLMPADFPVEKAANDNPVAEPQPHPPFQALAFLKRDLELLVGNTGRPVVLIHHYGFDPFSTGKTLDKPQLWWSWAQRYIYWETIKDYNVIAIFTGHRHLDDSWSASEPFVNPSDPTQSIPAFVTGAARGSSSNIQGTYLDVLITDNEMIVDKMNSEGQATPFLGSVISRSPPKLEIPESTPPYHTLETFVNPDPTVNSVGLKSFIVHNGGKALMGGTPLRVDSIEIDPPLPSGPGAPPPWIQVTTQSSWTGPFSVPVGGDQQVDVLVAYGLAPEGNTDIFLNIQSNDPADAGTGTDYVVRVSVNNIVSCSAPGAPILLAPANGSTTFDTTPAFSWQAVANASVYSIEARTSAGGVLAFGPVVTSVTNFEPVLPLAAGPYTWTVTGSNTNAGCNITGLTSTAQVTVGQPKLYLDRHGLGTVTSNPAGINCGGSCEASFPVGTVVQLGAIAFPGSSTMGATTFSGWSGNDDCSDGTVTMNGAIFCTATFESTEAILTIVKSGSGTGRVLSDPPGIDCGVDCASAYAFGTNPQVSLTTIPDEGSIFAFWVGCSSGSVIVDSDQSCTAVFRDRNEESRLSVDIYGGGYLTVSPGTGTVTSDVPGINCETDCSESYKVGTVVTLIPTPGFGSVFRDWLGGDSGCEEGIVDNGSDKMCRANFGPTLLLVDDDDNGPNVLSSYTNALDTLGVPYDVWDTEKSDKEPGAPILGQYSRVIWFSGFADSYPGPGAAGEANLATWLVTGQCLLISSQDYASSRGVTPFMAGFLRVAASSDGVAQNNVTGSGSVFSGLGPYSLSYPYDNHSDSLSPAEGAELAFSGNHGDAGVVWDSGFYKTMFLGFPLEALPQAEDRVAVLSRFLEFCDKEPVPEEVFINGFEDN